MKVSRVNMYSPSFGQIRKSAVKRAIERTGGDITKLEEVKELFYEQKRNHLYDIVAADSKFFDYEVIKANGEEESGIFCEDLKHACSMANVYRRVDEKRMAFNEMAREIWLDCDE